MAGQKGKNKRYERFVYTAEQMKNAITDVRNKTLNFNEACKKYGVPKTTLFKKVKGQSFEDRSKMGPKTVLSGEEEDMLENWILNKAKVGFPMHPDEVKDTVQKILKTTGRQNCFTDDRPGKKWLTLFLQRKSKISRRNAEILSKARASVTEEKLKDWFVELEGHLKDINCLEVLEDPSRIINLDEVGVQTCPKTGIVLGEKGSSDLYAIASGAEKESITVLCCFSADGRSQPPMIIYPYQRIPAVMTQSVPNDWAIGRSDTGWMQSSTFYEYVANVLYPWLVQKEVKLPIILFLDGHKSHLSMELSDFCVEKGIIVYCLPPNATHIMQPCDVSVFNSLKTNWNRVVREHKQTTNEHITKGNFAPLFRRAYDGAIKEETIKNGFKKSGLHPCDANAVDYSKCISKRREEVFGLNFDVAPDVENYITTKIAIEFIIGFEETSHFTGMKTSNVASENPLYKVWSFCANKMGGTSQSGPAFGERILEDHGLQDNLAVAVSNVGHISTSCDLPVHLSNDTASFSGFPIPKLRPADVASSKNVVLDIQDAQNDQAHLATPVFAGPADTTSKSQETGNASFNAAVENQEQENQREKENDVRATENRKNSGAEGSMFNDEMEKPLEYSRPKNESLVRLPNISTKTTPNKQLWTQHLHWPKIEDKKGRKRALPERVPFAITSESWRNREAEKAEMEIQKQQEADQKRLIRETMKKIKQEHELEKKKIRLEKAETKKKSQQSKMMKLFEVENTRRERIQQEKQAKHENYHEKGLNMFMYINYKLIKCSNLTIAKFI